MPVCHHRTTTKKIQCRSATHATLLHLVFLSKEAAESATLLRLPRQAFCVRGAKGTVRGGASQSRHHSACKRQQKEQFDVTSSRRQYQTVPATSCRGIDARFDGDTGYVVIDMSLLRHRIGRGCRPQRIDIQQNKLMRGCNALASTASPNAPISLPLAHGHLLLDGQCLKQAHGWGGAVFAQEERLLFFIIHFIYYFLFYANPLPSFIPRSLNLHNRQVNDRIAGEEEVLLKVVVVVAGQWR